MSKEESTSKDEVRVQGVEEKKKSYFNCYFCKVEIGVAITYFYLFNSVTLTLVNRILYQKFKFKFSFTLLFFQQLFCAIFFRFIATKNERFNKAAGEISFSNFKELKFYYLACSALFMGNCLSSFIASQLVVNTVMFLLLRKLLMIMNYCYDRFVNKKQLPRYFTFSVFCISGGIILSGLDDLSADYWGYFLVLVNNTFSLFYSQLGEQFRKRTGVPNIKLIVYNSYIATPVMLFAMIVSGEMKRFIAFIAGKSALWIIGFITNLLVSCCLCASLNSSLMCSFEKASSLFNQILTSCKDIIISPISYLILKDHRITVKTVLGMIISICGVIAFQYKTITTYFKFGDKNNVASTTMVEEVKVDTRRLEFAEGNNSSSDNVVNLEEQIKYQEPKKDEA